MIRTGAAFHGNGYHELVDGAEVRSPTMDQGQFGRATAIYAGDTYSFFASSTA